MNKFTVLMAGCLIVMILPTASVHAASVRWDLEGVTFEHGGQATGTFYYDTVNNAISSYDLLISNFSNPNENYTIQNGFNSASGQILNAGSLLQFTQTIGYRDYLLDLYLGTPISGEITADTLTTSSYIRGAGNNKIFLTAGSLVDVPPSTNVPEPGSIALLASGLLGFCLSSGRRFKFNLVKTGMTAG